MTCKRHPHQLEIVRLRPEFAQINFAPVMFFCLILNWIMSHGGAEAEDEDNGDDNDEEEKLHSHLKNTRKL